MQANWWKNLLKLSGLIGLSKLSGFVRDLIVAAHYGTSFIADAFNYASLFTAYPFILFGGLNGPFHSATMDSLSNHSNQSTNRSAQLICRICFWSLLIFGVLAIILYFFAGELCHIFFGKASSASLLSETIMQTRLMVPVLAVTGLIGILFGVSCFNGKQTLSSISPLWGNLALILCILSFQGGAALGLGVSIGAILQVLVLLPTLFQLTSWKDWASSWRLDGIKEFLLFLVPASLSSTVGSLNVYVDMFFCTSLAEGSWTAILLGNRLIQLPFGILVGAALVGFLPRISLEKAQPENFNAVFNRELNNLCFLMFPLAVFFLVLSGPVVSLLLQRGAFNANSTLLVSLVLSCLALSLITGLPRELATRAFYALGDSKTPFRLGLLSILVNAGLDFLLVRFFAVGGIALSTTITALFNSALLIFALRKHVKPDWFRLAKMMFVGLLLIPFYSGGYTLIYGSLNKHYSQYLNLFGIDLGMLLGLGLIGPLGFFLYTLFLKPELLTKYLSHFSIKISNSPDKPSE